MESLSVLNEFCTVSECNTTFTYKFIKIQIFWISTFHFPDFTNSMVDISTRSSSGWVITHVLDRTWSYLFSGKKCTDRIAFLFVPIRISENIPKSEFHHHTRQYVEIFGMSSYMPKSSSVEKFEIWRSFFIFITSSYLQQLPRYSHF